MAAFSVATTAFAAHAGGGFATGNQENTWFVSLGWPAIVVLRAKCKNVANKMQKIGFKKRHFKRLLNAK